MTFGSTFNLSDLNGSNGFTITGIGFDALGFSVSSAGDINGDGIFDLIVGATGADRNGKSNNGESYVIFGGSGVGVDGSFDLTTLNGSNGFAITGENSRDLSGTSVSAAGDINNDGFDDVIVGTPGTDNGSSYVVFGGPSGSFGSGLAVDNLNGNNGFSITGTRSNDRLGSSVSGGGDINGDGISDLVIGAPEADPNGFSSGQSYVIFGGSGIGAGGSLNVSNLNGSNGFALNGIDDFSDRSGTAVSMIGDVNNDGLDDLIIGAPSADPNDIQNAGESYVVFGRRSFGRSLELSDLNGSNGFVIAGLARGDGLGESLSGVGDVNNDGIDDFIVTAPPADANGESNAGESYVIFGRNGLGSNGSFELSSLDGTNGFKVNGTSSFSRSGSSVSGAGDVNQDGIADLIIGSANENGSFVLFGDRNIGRSGIVDLANLNGHNGLRFFDTRPSVSSFPGRAVSGTGDFNGDGIDDLVMANPSGSSTRGKSFVVFGQAALQPTAFVNGSNVLAGRAFGAGEQYQGAIFSSTDGSGDANDFIVGTGGRDNIWTGVQGNDMVDSQGGDDIVGIGDGNMSVDAGAGNDFVYAIGQGGGNNVINLGSGNDNFFVNGGNNTVTGSGNNLISAGIGRDIVTTRGGNDFVYSTGGGGGDDILNLGNGDNTVWVQNGNYSITTGSGIDTIGIGSGTDTIRAGDGDNFVYMITSGGGRKDVVTGSGDDYIQTGAGDDLIDGGSGFNSLFGGGGRDTFVMRRDAYSFLGDFQVGTDKIRGVDISFDGLSFFQGSSENGTADTTFIFAGSVALGQVDGTTVAALSNEANFEFV